MFPRNKETLSGKDNARPHRDTAAPAESHSEARTRRTPATAARSAKDKSRSRQVKQAPSQRTVEDYAREVLARFANVNTATEMFFEWARHDPDVARALGIHWLDTTQPSSGPLKSRIRSILEALSRPQPTQESEEHTAAFAEYLRTFRP